MSRTNLDVMGISLEPRSACHSNPEPVGNVNGSIPPHPQFSSTNGTSSMEIESSQGD